MFARSILIVAAVALGAGSAGAAEPAKAPPPANESRETAAPVLMASADAVRGAEVVAASSPQGTTVPAKRPRAARVTTCRCGDITNPNQ